MEPKHGVAKACANREKSVARIIRPNLTNSVTQQCLDGHSPRLFWSTRIDLEPRRVCKQPSPHVPMWSFHRFLRPLSSVRETVLGKRRFAVENATTRLCRETSGRVGDLDLPILVERDLPLFGGAQLAIDATFVFLVHCDGSARLGNTHRVLVPSRERTDFPRVAWSPCQHGGSFWSERSEVGGQMRRTPKRTTCFATTT